MLGIYGDGSVFSLDRYQPIGEEVKALTLSGGDIVSAEIDRDEEWIRFCKNDEAIWTWKNLRGLRKLSLCPWATLFGRYKTEEGVNSFEVVDE